METTLIDLVKLLLSGNGVYMISTIIAFLLITYVVLCVLAWLADKQQDIISAFYFPKKVLDDTETVLFKSLQASVPSDYFVFPHVSMRALIETNCWDMASWYNLKRVDFVICNADLKIVCVIELTDGKKRHKRRQKMLEKAGVNVLRYPINNLPDEDVLKKDILFFVQEGNV